MGLVRSYAYEPGRSRNVGEGRRAAGHCKEGIAEECRIRRYEVVNGYSVSRRITSHCRFGAVAPCPSGHLAFASLRLGVGNAEALSEMRAAFGVKSSGMGLDLLAVQAVCLSVHPEGGGDDQE